MIVMFVRISRSTGTTEIRNPHTAKIFLELLAGSAPGCQNRQRLPAE